MKRSEAVVSSVQFGSPIAVNSSVELLGRSVTYSYSIPGRLYESGKAEVVAAQVPAYGSGEKHVVLLRKESGELEYYDLDDIQVYHVGAVSGIDCNN